VTEEYRSDYRKLRLRGLLNYIFLLSLPPLGWLALGNPAVLRTWTVPSTPVFIGLALAGVLYHWGAGKCPRCSARLGRYWPLQGDCDNCHLMRD
jgi:hypothetical protein